jgi:hypothetical protein
LRAAAAYDFSPHLSAGLELSAILGGEGRDRVSLPSTGVAGFEAWNGLATVRAHLRDPSVSIEDLRFDFFVQAGAGIGNVISMQSDGDSEHAWLRGRTGPAFDLSVGGRGFVTSKLAVGLRLSWLIWTRVGKEAFWLDGWGYSSGQAGIVVTVLSLAATVGFASPL